MEVASFDKSYSSNVFESHHFYYTIENPLVSSASLKIQKVWRGHHSRMTSAQFIKKMKYRIHIITEIVKSEEAYLTHLDLLLQNCYHPLRKQIKSPAEGFQPIITQAQFEELFANLASIFEFNSSLHSAMVEEFTKLTPYSKFSQVMIKFADDFKIYYPYTANCEEANKMLEHLRKNNKRFCDFLAEVEYTEKLNNMELWSFIIKPVQRITKYPLLLADLLKNTPSCHSDYAGVEKALEIYKKINEENNLNIERYEKIMKMIEYQEIYGAKFNLLIYKPDRTILAETCVSSPQNPDAMLKMIVMTGLILVINHNYELKINDQYIELDGNSIIKDLPDTKYFSNLFSITGVNAGETFRTETKDEKRRLMSLVDQTIAEIRRKEIIERLGASTETLDQEKMQEVFQEAEYQKIEVHVAGTEQHIKDGKPKTYYVVLFAFCSQRFHKCFKRHSEFRQLSKALAEAFPKKKLPRCEKKFSLLKKFRTKTVEMRKIVIENLLQLALQDPQVRDSKVLQEFIKFPEGFFDKVSSGEESTYPERTYAFHQAFTGSPTTLPSESTLNTIKTVSNFKNVRSVEDTMRRYSAISLPAVYAEAFSLSLAGGYISKGEKSSRVEQKSPNQNALKEEEKNLPPEFDLNHCETRDLHEKKPKNSSKGVSKQIFDIDHFKYNLVVHLVNETSFEFKIDNRTNARSICKQISTQLRLVKDDDFRLFIVEGFDRERPLDGDECITDVMKLEEEKTRGFLNKVSKSVIGMFREQIQQKLIFKKYYYLPKKHERILCQADPTRINLLVAQCLQEVKELRYNFDHSKFLTIMCLGAYNQYFEEILREGPHQWFKNRKKKVFYAFISESIVKTKPKEFWKNGLITFWGKMLEQIDTTIKNNKQFIEEKMGNSSDRRMDLLNYDLINPEILVKHLILNLMWSHRCYGMSLYEARVYSPNEATVKRKWPSNKFLLGVKYGEIIALSMSKSKYYLSHKLTEIVDVKCFPVAIKIYFADYEIRLDTKKSFEIQQLISVYKKLEEALSSEKEPIQRDRNQLI